MHINLSVSFFFMSLSVRRALSSDLPSIEHLVTWGIAWNLNKTTEGVNKNPKESNLHESNLHELNLSTNSTENVDLHSTATESISTGNEIITSSNLKNSTMERRSNANGTKADETNLPNTVSANILPLSTYQSRFGKFVLKNIVYSSLVIIVLRSARALLAIVVTNEEKQAIILFLEFIIVGRRIRSV